MTFTPLTERPCTCHVVREGADGLFFSDADLGVLCPSCEARDHDYQLQSWWDSLTEAERIVERWHDAALHARYYQPRPGRRDEPPF